MISLFMHGGPSHVDLLDPKPQLSKHHGDDYGGDVVFSFVNRASKKLFASPWKFAKHGQCGTDVSELLPETARKPHFAAKATAMISLFMHGGPSHVDLLDPRPELQKSHGKEYGGDVGYSFVNRASKKLLGSPWKFSKHGKCGTEVSELLPHTAGIVDELCVIRSMHTGHNGHEVSIRYFHGGIAGITGRPTLGS